MGRFDDITEASLAALIHGFYGRAREDELLGPVFGAAVSDWAAHEDHLVAFWSSVMLGSGRFRGSPMAAHARQPISREMFPRWLALWAETVDSLFEPTPALRLKTTAARIGQSFELGLFYRPEDRWSA